MHRPFLTFSEMADGIAEAHGDGRKALAYLPVGCMEQHGPFLPLETDFLIAQAFAADLCGAMTGEKYWGYVFPAVHYSPTRSNTGFCGTVSVDEEPFRDYVRQVCRSLIKPPFDALVIVSGHGPADPSLREICFQLVNQQYSRPTQPVIPAVVISIFDYSPQIEKLFKMKPGKHADWREFLLLYHLLGDEYFEGDRLKKMRGFKKDNSFRDTASLIIGVPTERRSTAGVIGDPLPGEDVDLKTSSRELWNHLLNAVLERLFNDLESFAGRGY